MPRRTLTVLTLVFVLALFAPMLVAGRANLTSDESLYLAEAYAIARGHGLAYPSGDPITHRAPGFPAMLAPAVRIGGPHAAYDVTKTVIIVNALLLALLALRFSGGMAAAAAGLTAAASSYLNGLGQTLYLDPAQCTFLLLSLLCLHEATRSHRERWLATSGLALGAAFLVKESALQWAPLAFCAWLGLPSLRDRAGARGVVAAMLVFLVVGGSWWGWVYAQTSQIYLIGAPTTAHVALLAVAVALPALFAGATVVWPRASAGLRATGVRVALPCAAAVIALWTAFMLVALTRYSSWPYPEDYLHTVPAYLGGIASQAQPAGLLALAWPWAMYRAARGDDGHRLVLVAGLLYLPFALFAANRGLQLRDALPLVYLSYLLLGMGVSDAFHLTRRIEAPAGALLLSAAVVAAIALCAQQVWRFQSQAGTANADAVSADAWDNTLARHMAGWMRANLPDDSRVLSSRLYFSSLYVNSGGRFEIRQMPTVRVNLHPSDDEPLVTAASDLFRWGDGPLRPTRPGDQWLYLKQYPGKDYWVGLSQQELVQYIAAQRIQYVVLTGDDGVFSSTSYADYFSSNPGFQLMHYENASPTAQFFVYRVIVPAPAPKSHSTVIAPGSLRALERATGLSEQMIAARLGTRVRVPSSDYGLSDGERWNAVVGIDGP